MVVGFMCKYFSLEIKKCTEAVQWIHYILLYSYKTDEFKS